jgi:acetylxylan esterase
MNRCRNHIVAVLTINAGLFFTVRAEAGTWQDNAPFGAALQGDLYTPTTPGPSPAILCAIHYCSGNSANAHSWFQSYADQYGFYIIAPNAGKNCFDSSASRSGDRDAIVTMVNYVLAHTNADRNRVFSAGLSSGGCMTNTLLAIYPDVFAGGVAMPGFPAGLWPAGDTSCTKCGSSPGASDTGQHYASLAESVFSFSGTRPCSAQWVGGGDQYNFNGWLPIVTSQFQILGSLGSASPGAGAPSGWTRTEYKDSSGNVRLQTNLGPSSQMHDLSNVSGMFGQVVTFLGLDKATGACGITSNADGGIGSSGSSSGSGGSSSGSTGSGGSSSGGGSGSSGGSGGSTSSSGVGNTSSSGSASSGAGSTSSGGNASSGAVSSSGSTDGGAPGGAPGSSGNGCSCHSSALGGTGEALLAPAIAGAAIALRRRRRTRV